MSLPNQSHSLVRKEFYQGEVETGSDANVLPLCCDVQYILCKHTESHFTKSNSLFVQTYLANKKLILILILMCKQAVHTVTQSLALGVQDVR